MSSTWADERTDNHASQQELHLSGEWTGSMPTAPTVKQLATVWTQKREDVLEVGGGTGQRSDRRGIQRPAFACEEKEADESAANLEAS